MQSVHIITKVVRLIPAHYQLYLIQFILSVTWGRSVVFSEYPENWLPLFNERVYDCCSMPNKQIFSDMYIMREQVTFDEMMMMSASSLVETIEHWYTCHSTLTHYPDSEATNLYFHHNAVCLVEKQLIPMLKSLVWSEWGLNLQSTTIETSTATITSPDCYTHNRMK
jgi:hypothetical protein